MQDSKPESESHTLLCTRLAHSWFIRVQANPFSSAGSVSSLVQSATKIEAVVPKDLSVLFPEHTGPLIGSFGVCLVNRQ